MTPSDKPADGELQEIAEVLRDGRIAGALHVDLRALGSRVISLLERLQAAEARIDDAEEATRVALREVVRLAREAGDATGRLEMSEAAGIVEGWRERALAAEASRLSVEGEMRKVKAAFDALTVDDTNFAQCVRDTFADYGLFTGQESTLSQDPGPHPCGEQPGADVAATAALAPGWVAVPVEPTETMCSAGDRAQYDTDEDHELSPLVYAAMIAAAPRSPLTGEGGE